MTDEAIPENQGEAADTLRRRAQFDAYWVEQQTRERANSEKYDNTILAYSTGALGLSVAFIKDVIPLGQAHVLWTLKWSWVMFGVSLLLMLASFPIAQAANRASIQFAEKYFIEKNVDYCNKVGWAGKILRWLNPLAGLAFLTAAVFTTAFVWVNVQEHHIVIENKVQPAKTGSQQTTVKRGVESAMMPKTPQPSLPRPSSEEAPSQEAPINGSPKN